MKKKLQFHSSKIILPITLSTALFNLTGCDQRVVEDEHRYYTAAPAENIDTHPNYNNNLDSDDTTQTDNKNEMTASIDSDLPQQLGDVPSKGLVISNPYDNPNQETVNAIAETAENTLLQADYLKDPTSIQSAVILFGFDKIELSEAAQTSLQEIALEADQSDDSIVLIEGYADAQGDAIYNDQLAKRRSEQVANRLGREGVDMSRVIVKSYGAERVKKTHPESRRVEISIMSVAQYAARMADELRVSMSKASSDMPERDVDTSESSTDEPGLSQDELVEKTVPASDVETDDVEIQEVQQVRL